MRLAIPLLLCGLLCGLLAACTAQRELTSPYEPSRIAPYGMPNPDAPVELAQFDFLIGANDCHDERRQGNTDNWVSTQRSWDAHYTMNGYAIFDSGRSQTSANGNVRVFDPATGQWHVTFFSMPVYGSGVWTGGMAGESMVLTQPQKAPGTDLSGVSRLTFSNISSEGFDWIGEWVSSDGSYVFPFWRISCQKVRR